MSVPALLLYVYFVRRCHTGLCYQKYNKLNIWIIVLEMVNSNYLHELPFYNITTYELIEDLYATKSIKHSMYSSFYNDIAFHGFELIRQTMDNHRTEEK